MKKEFGIGFPSILPSRSKDDCFPIWQETPRVLSQVWLWAQNRSWNPGAMVPSLREVCRAVPPLRNPGRLLVNILGKYQVTIFKSSGCFNYSYDKITFRFK